MSLPIKNTLFDQHLQCLKPIDIHQPRNVSLAVYALMLGSASMLLLGCQTSATVSKTSANSMIDFSVANEAQSQAQAKNFRASLKDNDERYQQLFDQNRFPSAETQAKSLLVKALRQHLATEQVSVAQAHYQSIPFIESDSIDAGSSSLLKTFIELYAYNQSSDYDDDMAAAELEVADARAELAAAAVESAVDDYTDYDSTDVTIVDESDSDAIVYNAEGYDIDGYDAEGYDIDGYDYDGYDEEGYDVNGFDYDGYDEYGYDEYGNYGYSSDDNDDRGVRSKLNNLNPKELLGNYEAMQAKKQQAINNSDSATTATTNDPSTGILGIMLGMLQRTPEQVQALNTYQYKNLTFNSVSHYKPEQKQLQSVYSYDYLTPTISSSVQIPLALDFANNRLTIDPSALMPLVALINPEHTPLPDQMSAYTVDFGLPETITSQLPSAVIYDAVIAAISDSMAELAAENFSAVDTRGDQFAQQIRAARAIKVYFGSQQSGEMLGKMLKYISQSLEDYVNANPDKYPDDAALKTAINKIQLYNKGYQSADVGALLQLIEAIGPISFNQVNHYYLDNTDRLVGKQQRLNIGGDLFGLRTTVLNQIRYDKTEFDRHSLKPLLTQSFGANAKPAIDGNAWLAKQREQKDKLAQARYARYSYEDSDYDMDELVIDPDGEVYESDSD